MTMGTRRWIGLGAAAWLGMAGCTVDPDVGGETHWLAECASDGDCGAGFCQCGVCTVGCMGDGECQGGEQPAKCYDLRSPGLAGACEGADISQGGVCLATCTSASDCQSGQTCQAGACLSLVGSEEPPEQSTGASPSKVDLLIVVDNSIGMADHQAIFADTIPSLIERFAKPDCVDAGGVIVPQAGDECPSGSSRRFPPVDLHVGVVTSSLGSFGSSACSPRLSDDPNRVEQFDDRAHLLGSRPRAAALGLDPPFLAWAPGAALEGFAEEVGALTALAGDVGCGYEAPLEAMYRFLADPDPYEKIELGPCSGGSSVQCAHRVGVDDVVLGQRQAFLRPDSLLAVALLSDENDCSIRPDGQLYLVADPSSSLPQGSSACAQNPNDPCCYPCSGHVPTGCMADPACDENRLIPRTEDHPNLRCWETKRRFGIDFLHPTERYVRALTAPTLCKAGATLDIMDCDPADVVPNPLFAGTTGGGRGPEDVLFLPIVGVPWQDLALEQDPELHYATGGQIPWDLILGQPQASPPVPPLDPYMHESTEPRAGTNPVTGFPIEPIGAGYMASPINGHEWNIIDDGFGPDDLQYACVVPLTTPRDCVGEDSCECYDSAITQNPLCQAPDGSYGTVQYAAKAYPGLRHLEVARGMGERALVGSICARNTTNPLAQDFGHRPALGALFEAAARRLGAD
jgi:hypothetical protein